MPHPMSQKAISEHLQVQQTRYQNRPGRKARSLLFDKCMTFSGPGRKHLIKVRGGRLPVGGQPGTPAGPGRGRPPAYGKILPLIKALWLVSEQPCGKPAANAS